MKLPVISIGDSKGILFTKAILKKYNITDTVELVMEKERIILKPKSKPRKGWDKAFKKMHDTGDDMLLIKDVFEDENFDKWT